MSKKFIFYLFLITCCLSLASGNLWAVKDCVNTYCHGYFAGSGRASTATWTDASSGKCGTCHSAGRYAYNPSDVGQSTAPAGGSHYLHTSTTTYNYLCKLCHSDTVINWGASTTTVRLSTATHVTDRATDIQFSTYSLTRPQIGVGVSSPTYFGFDAWNLVYSTQPPDTTYGKCENLYCHGVINTQYAVRRSTPLWGLASDGDCGTCHDASMYDLSSATAPVGWKHFKHASSGTVTGAYSYQCRYCHENTVTWAGTIAFATWTHVQGLVDIKFSTSPLTIGSGGTAGLYKGTTYYVGVATNSPYNESYCKNIYCHSDGKREVNRNYRTVYSTDTVGCNSCHGGTENYTILTATHVIHASTNTLSGRREYDYTCDTCHRDTVSSGSKTAIKNYTLHVSSTANVSFATSTAVGYNRTFDKNAWARYVVWSSSGTCWDTYCHSDGTSKKSTLAPSSTIYWGR